MKKIKRIGIDIDGVLTEIDTYLSDYFTKFLVENNIDYKVDEFSYEDYKTYNVSQQVGRAFWDKYLIDYSVNVPAKRFASEIINKLKQDGFEIYIITARWSSNFQNEAGKQMRKIVREWLEKYDIHYDKLIFSNGKNESKTTEIEENEIDLMIEDNPNNIEELSKTIPVICYDNRYNQKVSGKNVYRCYSWFDIYHFICNFTKNNS